MRKIKEKYNDVRIAFVTYGCPLNFSDSEIMAGILKSKGYDIVDEDEANLVVVNGCTVKNLAEKKFFNKINELRKKGKKVIAAGCVAQAEPGYVNTKLKDISVIGTYQIDRIADVVESTLKGKRIVFLDRGYSFNNRLFPKVRRNPIIEIVPINEGCLGNCSFCKTKFARGNLKSYKIGDIIKQIKIALNNGVKEIWLTSQDTGAYGHDIGKKLPDLLKKVVDIKSDFKVRLGMGNPEFFIDFIDDIADVFKSEKMFRFLHLPLQSGNDRILKLMNRRYNIDQYVNLVTELKNKIRDLTLSTDIIVGFPTETEEEFMDSVNIIKKIKPDMLNISRFWARPGTLASRMKQLPTWISKERSRYINKVFNRIALGNNKKWVGWKGKILIDESGKNKTMIGRNFAYKQVIVDNGNLGDYVDVVINDFSRFDLRGKVMD